MKYYYGLLFLIIILSVIIFFPYVPSLHQPCNKDLYNKYIERFSNYKLTDAGPIPTSETMPLLDSFPFVGNQVNANNYSDIWWHYPVFSEPSYKQITNNLRYRNNPDDGTCIRADFCNNTLYGNVKNQSNYSTPLPVAPLITPGSVRINYYTADQNLFLGGRAGPDLQAFAN